MPPTASRISTRSTSAARHKRLVADSVDDNPHRYMGVQKAAEDWARRHPNPCNPFRRQRNSAK